MLRFGFGIHRLWGRLTRISYQYFMYVFGQGFNLGFIYGISSTVDFDNHLKCYFATRGAANITS